ncbi:MAG: DUF362 domain-containing protein [Defluviitaleaceae bacterium]|nr:DUF362 domain-containing protein [Defluviitaleaceae bacterium]
MKRIAKICAAMSVVMIMGMGCLAGTDQGSSQGSAPSPAAQPVAETPAAETTADDGDWPFVSTVFVEDTDGTDDGMERLIASMEDFGYAFFQTEERPDGLFAADDVVLLQINAQWDERGGTNTDLIDLVIRALLDHPEGFSGEIIVADNGQAQFGSAGRGGSLDWENSNAMDISQSTMTVVNRFNEQGYHVTGVLWDEFTLVRVDEFSEGDMTDGFVVEDYMRETGFEISYPKFTTEFGTHVSFREGIWNPEDDSFDSERLKVVNMPVLKSHFLFQVTGAVKGYMGTVSDRLTGHRPHNSVGLGGMGTQMAHTRMPVLNIMDMIWIAPDRGPAAQFDRAVQINKIAVSTDPVALDVWATVNVLMPEAERFPGGRAAPMSPEGDEPGTFGHWLRLSLNEMLDAGYDFTMDIAEIGVVEGGQAQ